jgi:hypothetical protein
MHQLLHFIEQFAHFEASGAISYYITCLQGSVEFISQYELPKERMKKFGLGVDEEAVAAQKVLDEDADGGSPPAPAVEGDGDIEKLGEWLRYQETMEDTISILQKEGWMA